MDLKDVLLNSENSLPTLAQNLSTAAAQGSGLTFTGGESTFIKIGLSTVLGLLGAYYLGAGKKQGDVNKMLLGAAMLLGSFFLF